MASALLGLLVAAAIGVGIYALVNPNDISFAAPWPVIAEVLAGVAAFILLAGISDVRSGDGRAMLVTGVVLTLVALTLLAAVALALSFNAT
jgi:hypothetical protein